MNTGPALAPPPALRRRRQLRAEPLVFAVLLTLLTLGINLSGVPKHAEPGSKPGVAHVASAR